MANIGGKRLGGLQFLVLGAVAFCAACTTPINPKQKILSAPTSQREAGWLVKGASESEIAQFLEQNPQAKVRLIHSRRQISEFRNVDYDSLKQAFPHSKISRNQFYEQQSASAEIIAGQFLFRCRKKTPSTNLIKIVHPTEISNSSAFQIELGQPLELKATPPSSSTLLWSARAPFGSSFGDSVETGDVFARTPDMVGLYQIFLISRDEAGDCFIQGLSVGVTANQDFVSGAVPPLPPSLDFFSHLEFLNVKEAWQYSRGKDIVVAVIDSGANYNHPYLAPNIFSHSGEIPGNGIDDDNNGFVDDFVGYDFVNLDPFPWDDAGHGSHVTGLLAGVGFGVAPEAKILTVKGMGPLGGDIGSLVASIYYSIDNGAHIINLSWGRSDVLDPLLAEAIDYAQEKNVLVVAAAGNGNDETGLGVDIDKTPLYPAALPNENILTVTARDRHNPLALYANYGKESVDVTAFGGFVGDEILSAYVDNPAGILFVGYHGTSMATPQVSGVAALAWAQAPDQSYKQIKERILQNGEPNEDLKNITQSGQFVDALKAVKRYKDPLQAQRPEIIHLAP